MKRKIYLGSEQIKLRDVLLSSAKLRVTISSPSIRLNQALSLCIREYFAWKGY